MSSDRLVVFTRFPIPGLTKTRLIPALGPEGAAQLQREMTEWVMSSARRLGETDAIDLEVRFEGGDSTQMGLWLGHDLSYVPQGDGDLGDRMQRAVTESLESDHRRTIIIGADCPQLTPDVLLAAFGALNETDAVIGPASDGGYYLIGLRRPNRGCGYKRIFRGLPWGSRGVYGMTLKLMGDCNLSVSILPVLSDVDEPSDLPVWHEARQGKQRVLNL